MHKILRHQHHQLDAEFFGLGPRPVELAFNQRLLQNGDVKRETHAEHAGLLQPGLDCGFCIRRFRIEAAHDRVTVGVRLGGSDGEVVAVAFPRRRHDHYAVNAGFVHVFEQLLVAQRNFALRMRARGPGPLRHVGAPDMYL